MIKNVLSVGRAGFEPAKAKPVTYPASASPGRDPVLSGGAVHPS